ncbi:MAG: glucosylceramidase [Chitinophagaceae bacterium]|jgi:glucosylceramidase|nr:glucosylceramidase [Chitinophagaceae bacterium]
MKFRKSISIPLLAVMAIACTDKKAGTDPVPATSAEAWVTTGSQSQLLKKQTASITFSDQSDIANNIDVDSTQSFQTVDGFGFTLTGGSAYLINRMDGTSKSNLLKELFGNGADAIGISYLRVSIGASDLSAEVFSYNDLPAGQTDPTLAQFSLSQDTVDLLPVLKEILQINPSIKIMGSPWSPPVWMKDNGNSKGGSLLPQYYATYAQYFVKYIRAMEANGIRVDAITPQNEPQHGGNNPSMVMSAQQQADFIKNHLGPAFQAAGITTKIIVWDHNCDNPNYPITIMNDAAAKAFIDGSAFHLYAGDISALSGVKAAHPDKNLYFTEQWTGANGSFDGDLKWHVKNVIIGSMRNWSRIALEWNLANDPSYGPHTPGGCTECKGALTLNASVVTRNVSYYIVGHASKFVYPGSKRIESNGGTNLHHAAFLRPDGKKVLIVLNETGTASDFNIRYKGKLAKTSIPAGSVATYVW